MYTNADGIVLQGSTVYEKLKELKAAVAAFRQDRVMRWIQCQILKHWWTLCVPSNMVWDPVKNNLPQLMGVVLFVKMIWLNRLRSIARWYTCHSWCVRFLRLSVCVQHIFCEACIAMWFDRERTCPLCRAAVSVDPLWRDGSTTMAMQIF